MNKTIKVLSVVLAAQLLVAVLFFVGRRGPEAFKPHEPLLNLKDGDFDRVVLSEPDRPPIVLVRTDNRWRLPDRWNFPVAPAKVSQTLDVLVGLKISLPVGSTGAARKRFKVADDVYEKRVEFFQGEKSKGILYVGSSPGYRQVHLRPAHRDGVFVGEFGAHELSVRPEDWEDKTHLHLDRQAIGRVQTPSVTLIKSTDGFVVDGLAPTQETIPGEADSLLSRVAAMPYMELLGTEVKPAYGLASPALTVDITMSDGTTVQYAFGSPAEGGTYYLKTSRSDHVFKVGAHAVDPIRQATRKSLSRKKTASPSS